jgi:hypothetical protein
MPASHLLFALWAAALLLALTTDMAAGSPGCVDVILAGRPGNGKSTLGDIAVGQLVFPGAFKATHVTTAHAHAKAPPQWTLAGGLAAVIHDTPGLDQDVHYPRHRAELQKAFVNSCGRQVIVFTVGVAASGRVNANDVKQMTAIVRAYGLQPMSVLIVFNMVPAQVGSAVDAYLDQVVAELPSELKPYAANRLAVPYMSDLATDKADDLAAFVMSSTGEAQEVRKRLYAALARLTPSSHSLKNPQALETAAETSERLRQEQLRLEQEQRRAAAARQAAEAEQERARQEQRRIAEEKLRLERELHAARQKLSTGGRKGGGFIKKMLRKLF